MKVGIFPMVGDLLHAGHIAALNEAKQHCDVLVVALNCNPCDNPNKEKPVESVYERYLRVRSLNAVDVVIPYEGEADLELLLKTIEYHVRFIGEDYAKQNHWTGKEYEMAHDIEHRVIGREHGLSSTSLKDRIRNSNKRG